MSEAALVTGATGFVGRHLCAALQSSDVEVHAAVRSEEAGRSLPPGANPVRSDKPASELRARLQPLGIGRVFHLATHFVAEHTSEDVEPLIDSNLLLGCRIAEAVASEEHPPVFVNVGTAWQRGGRPNYHPTSLYAATKEGFENLLYYYALRKRIWVANLRLFDSYGPNDPRNKLVSALLHSAEHDRRLELSPGEQLINLCHVTDVVSAIIHAADLVAEDPSLSWETWAIYGADTLTVRELLGAVETATSKSINAQWGARPYRKEEMFEMWDVGTPLPGWLPAIRLEEGLEGLVRS